MSTPEPLSEQAQSILTILRASDGKIRSEEIFKHSTFRAVRTTPQSMGKALHDLVIRGLLKRVAPKVYAAGPAEPTASLKLGTPVETQEHKGRGPYKKRRMTEQHKANIKAGLAARNAMLPTLVPAPMRQLATRSSAMLVEVRAGSEIALTIGDVRLMVRAVI